MWVSAIVFHDGELKQAVIALNVFFTG